MLLVDQTLFNRVNAYIRKKGHGASKMKEPNKPNKNSRCKRPALRVPFCLSLAFDSLSVSPTSYIVASLFVELGTPTNLLQ